MDIIWGASTLLIAATLLISGAAKLRDPAATAAGFDSLKVPKMLAADWMKRLLPWAEIALGLGLLFPSPLAALAGGAALVLFGIYTWLIARALRSGEQADCNCFGSLASGQVTRRTLVRNCLLLLLAGAVLLGAPGRGSVLVWVATGGVQIWAWLLMLVLGMSLVAASLGSEQATAPGPLATAPAAAGVDDDEEDYHRLPIPFASLRDANGVLVPLRQLAAQRPVLLVFVMPGCGPCAAVIANVNTWAAQLPMVDIQLVTRSIPQFFQYYTGVELAGVGVLADPEGDLAATFGYLPTPAAVLLGADGWLAGGPVLGAPEITDLVEAMIAQLTTD